MRKTRTKKNSYFLNIYLEKKSQLQTERGKELQKISKGSNEIFRKVGNRGISLLFVVDLI